MNALVRSGGGVERETFDLICGTSIGALNGAAPRVPARPRGGPVGLDGEPIDMAALDACDDAYLDRATRRAETAWVRAPSVGPLQRRRRQSAAAARGNYAA